MREALCFSLHSYCTTEMKKRNSRPLRRAVALSETPHSQKKEVPKCALKCPARPVSKGLHWHRFFYSHSEIGKTKGNRFIPFILHKLMLSSISTLNQFPDQRNGFDYRYGKLGIEIFKHIVYDKTGKDNGAFLLLQRQGNDLKDCSFFQREKSISFCCNFWIRNTLSLTFVS